MLDELVRRKDVISIIDSVMNNREIDSIRNAILAIRDKVIEMEGDENVQAIDGDVFYAKMFLRGDELHETIPWFEGARYVVIDTMYKIDTGVYGEIRYE